MSIVKISPRLPNPAAKVLDRLARFGRRRRLFLIGYNAAREASVSIDHPQAFKWWKARSSRSFREHLEARKSEKVSAGPTPRPKPGGALCLPIGMSVLLTPRHLIETRIPSPAADAAKRRFNLQPLAGRTNANDNEARRANAGVSRNRWLVRRKRQGQRERAREEDDDRS
uniref:Uncharacterized protein n=1 Tax=Plectus sambesii TaxID=2011161 RepID=A0A914VRW1_9BILA